MPQLNCHGQAIHVIVNITVVTGSNHQSSARVHRTNHACLYMGCAVHGYINEFVTICVL